MAAPPDIDRILEAIRAEARSRGSRDRVGTYAADPGAGAAMPAPTHGLPRLDARHVADFLALPLDVFLDIAYREVLGREPDAGGAAHYQRALLRGRITRMEVLGRLAFSGEGRRRGKRPEGLAAAFAFALAYRVPVLGPVAAFASALLRLPMHLRDRTGIEAGAAATGSWMRR